MIRKKSTEPLDALVSWKGKRVVDVGCGEGHLVRHLARQGARVTGLEVQAAQLAKATAAERVGDEEYLEGGAQAMPIAEATVDVVVFFNSLHHVPEALMGQALAEAARVLKPGGLLYVSEPVASGPFFELVRPVDDETEVRARAIEALERVSELGLSRVAGEQFLHPVVLDGFEAFRRRIVGADGTRAAKVAALEAGLRAELERLGRRTAEGWEFEQPTRVDVFVKG